MIEENFTLSFEEGVVVEEETLEGVQITGAGKNILTSNPTTIILPVVYIMVFFVGLLTNTIAIRVFLFRIKKKHPASILMFNLALADLLFIICLPLKIVYHYNGNNWIFGEPLCKVLVGFFFGNMYCSTIFIACISVQRYLAITHPLTNKLTNRQAVSVSVCVWLLVWLITTPLYLYDQTVKVINLNITSCHDAIRPSQEQIPVRYFLTMAIVGYVAPCVVCVVAYMLMFLSLRRSRTESSSKKKKKAMILMIIVLVMFLVCFTPSNVMQIVHYSLLSSGFEDNSYDIYILTLSLSSLNSCLDPFLYYFISADFRKNMKIMLKCHSKCSAQ